MGERERDEMKLDAPEATGASQNPSTFYQENHNCEWERVARCGQTPPKKKKEERERDDTHHY